MNKTEMSTELKHRGLKLRYIPVWDHEAKQIELKCRKEAHIIDGQLVGTMAVATPTGVQVWTNKRKLARTIHQETHAPTIIYDTEAQITLPYPIADQYLRKLGIKVKRTMSKESIQLMSNRLKNHS